MKSTPSPHSGSATSLQRDTSQQETLTSDRSSMSSPTTSEATTSAISSPGSVSGRSLSGSPGGLTTDLFGQEVAPVLPSQRPESARRAHAARAACLSGALDELATQYARTAAMHGLPMPAIYGRSCGASSPSAALQESLASRLRRQRGWSGSPEYAVRWRSADTLLGPRISRLQAVERRTSDSGFSGWPTPMAGNPGKPGQYNPAGNTDSSRRTEALMAGWATPRARDHKGNGVSIERRKMGVADSLDMQCKLVDPAEAAKLTGWTTPTAHDVSPRGSGQKARHGTKHGCADLNADARMVGWPSPTTPNGGRSMSPDKMDATGRTADGRKHTASLEHAVKFCGRASPSSVTTERPDASPATKRAGLNPRFSLWLMLGPFAIAWASCGEAVTRSRRSRRRNS